MNIQYWISVLAFLFAGTINGQPIVKSKVDMLMKKAELTHSGDCPKVS